MVAIMCIACIVYLFCFFIVHSISGSVFRSLPCIETIVVNGLTFCRDLAFYLTSTIVSVDYLQFIPCIVNIYFSIIARHNKCRQALTSNVVRHWRWSPSWCMPLSFIFLEKGLIFLSSVVMVFSGNLTPTPPKVVTLCNHVEP